MSGASLSPRPGSAPGESTQASRVREWSMVRVSFRRSLLLSPLEAGEEVRERQAEAGQDGPSVEAASLADVGELNRRGVRLRGLRLRVDDPGELGPREEV